MTPNEPTRKITEHDGHTLIDLVGAVDVELAHAAISGDPDVEFVAVEIGGRIFGTPDRIDQLYVMSGAAVAAVVRHLTSLMATHPTSPTSRAFHAYLAEHPLPTIGGDHG